MYSIQVDRTLSKIKIISIIIFQIFYLNNAQACRAGFGDKSYAMVDRIIGFVDDIHTSEG